MNAIFRSILDAIGSVVGNHGVAVILFTLLIRLVLMPLDYRSRKSMRRMEKVNPQLQALQKKYANDKEKLQKKQADLYKKEKINPMGQCLPLLLSFPILIIMFNAMRGAANERLVQSMLTIQQAVGNMAVTDVAGIQAALPPVSALVEPFLWIKNLWMADSPFVGIIPSASSGLAAITGAIEGIITADELTALKAFIDGEVYQQVVLPFYGATPMPGATLNLLIITFSIFAVPNGFFILPLFSGVSQYFTSTLTTPQQTQPAAGAGAGGGMGGTGAFMKWFFPIFSVYICATSNAAFSLYWVVTNIVSMIQQIGFRMYFDAQDRKAAAQAEEVSL